MVYPSLTPSGLTCYRWRRRRRIYRATHDTFEAYCRERWGMSRVHAHRLIDAAGVAGNLLPMGNVPATESQARPLARLEPERQREAWSRAVETAPDGRVTAAHVASIVAGYRGPCRAPRYRRSPRGPGWRGPS
jgi:hypothetical protein